MVEARAGFAAELSNVGDARRFVRRTLSRWGADDLEYGATQALSELATNSVIHARTGFEVELALEGGALRVAVSDGSARAPVMKSHSLLATTGRGLGLVVALSESWGVERRPNGKTVWCRLVAGRDSMATPDERLAERGPPSSSGPPWGEEPSEAVENRPLGLAM